MTLADVHGHFVWYELSTTNIEAAKAFYREVLGWGALDMSMPGMPYAAFTLRELPVCGLLKLSEEAIKKGGSPHWIGYIAVRDVDRTVSTSSGMGASYAPPPQPYSISVDLRS